jgi:hypothetical protein
MNKLLDAEDILTFARDHIECVFMAAGQLPREEGDPIQVVADTGSKKIAEAIALLNEYRESEDSAGPVFHTGNIRCPRNAAPTEPDGA